MLENRAGMDKPFIKVGKHIISVEAISDVEEESDGRVTVRLRGTYRMILLGPEDGWAFLEELGRWSRDAKNPPKPGMGAS